jgi:3'(2'), 5'-bisphosphate nucleotidase
MKMLLCLDHIESIAIDAGKAIMKIYQSEIKVEFKSDHSPLTKADINANQIIIEALQKGYPHIPILSEESVEDFKSPSLDGYYWLVDPLDGTKEFVRGSDEFTVNIALIHHGIPVLGVVYAPAKQLIYKGAKGHGAFKREGDHELTAISTLKHTSGSQWRVMGSRSHLDDATHRWLSSLSDYELIPMGSSLKLCLIAEGSAHLYPRLGPTSLWDIAAGHVILKEAGGEIRSLEGRELNYANPSVLLNPYFIASSQDINLVL